MSMKVGTRVKCWYCGAEDLTVIAGVTKLLVINATSGKVVKEAKTLDEATAAVDHYVEKYPNDTYYVARVEKTNTVQRAWV